MPTPEDDEYTSNLTKDVLSAAIHQHLGISLISQSPYHAVIQVTTGSEHMTPSSTLHGGITTLLLDSVCFLALIPTLSAGQSAATAASSFQLMNPVAGLGKVVRFGGKVVRRGGSVAFCEGEAILELSRASCKEYLGIQAVVYIDNAELEAVTKLLEARNTRDVST
ncbi:hypothetical protein BP5796_08619 [Coleophoma crateriformis]|uniref:Thioesterase domain-containing protein n=1 Tax=Coleophoma crateriformis TaxID=565419 RepID=A0A3D8R842_9HELO|nr:hypothetical protein BP5796_08619 [Coleophoma crateriformis]